MRATFILLSTKTGTERYYRIKTGWVKESLRDRKFPTIAEQVLLLPVLARIKPGIAVKVEHVRQT